MNLLAVTLAYIALYICRSGSGMKRRHEWEGTRKGPGGRTPHLWDSDDDEDDEADGVETCAGGSAGSASTLPAEMTWDSGSDVEQELGQEEAGRFLVDTILNANAKGRLPATDACIQCFFAWKAGIEAARPFALRPGAPTGHYQRKLNKALGYDIRDPSNYELYPPMYSKHFESRTVTQKLIGIPAHESLVAEAVRDSTLRNVCLDATEWPPIYHNHQVVQAAPPSQRLGFIPTAIYFDGVPCTKEDGFLGVFLQNLLTGLRHTLLLVRKSCFCKCGCRGWCTMWAIFKWVTWGLVPLAQGTWPTTRHDKSPWLASDADRAKMVGSLGISAVVLMVKADWAEICNVLGFPTWSTVIAPCVLCDCVMQNIYNFGSVSLSELPWKDKLSKHKADK